VLLQEGDASRVPIPAKVLQDDRGGHLGIGVEHRRDGVLVRIELGAGGLPLVARRFGKLEESDHRGAAHAEPLGDRRLSEALPIVEVVDLCPVVHVVHPFLLPSSMTGGSVENRNRCGRC